MRLATDLRYTFERDDSGVMRVRDGKNMRWIIDSRVA